MAKITRFPSNINQPSAVTGQVSQAPNTASGALTSVSGLLSVGVNQAYAEEAAAQKALDESMEKKQKIVDNLDAGARTTEFEEESVTLIDELKEEFAGEPLKAVEEYKKRITPVVNEFMGDASNDTVGIELSQVLPTRVSQGVRSLRDWVDSRQTENTKGNLSKIFKTAANGAKKAPNADSLLKYLTTMEKNLFPMTEQVYGNRAQDEIDKVSKDAVKGYGLFNAKENPLQLLNELKNPAFTKYLESTEVEELRTYAGRGYDDSARQIELRIAKEAFAEGETLSTLVGTDGFVDAAYSRVKALEAEKETYIENKEGLKDADRSRMVEETDRRIKRVKTLLRINYSRIDTQAVDDPETLNEIFAEQNRIFKKKAKKSLQEDLSVLLEQLDRILAARDKKKITYGTYKTLFDDIAFKYKKALEEEQDNTSHWIFWQDAREAGNDYLGELFEGPRGSKFPDEVKNRASARYIRYLNEATENGKEISVKESRKLVNRAFMLETGEMVGGVE